MSAVLLIDRDPQFRSEICDLLLAHYPELDVIDTDDASQMLAAGELPPLSMVVLDIRLKEPGGLVLMEQLHRCYRHVPVVVLTELDSEEYRSAARARGACRFISKRQQDVRECIFACLESLVLE